MFLKLYIFLFYIQTSNTQTLVDNNSRNVGPKCRKRLVEGVKVSVRSTPVNDFTVYQATTLITNSKYVIINN